MLACEADLQAIDLLRRIFARSMRPILLMISEFITIGSFEDPFNEFFVEKLFRQDNRGKRAEKLGAFAASDEYVYKVSGDHDKIPVFLNDAAYTIYKIGCDLNLLKTKR